MDPTCEHQTSDIEVLKKMEDEHLRLQRQVRMIQTDRLQRTMGVHPQFRSQDELLRALKAEYISLCKDLKIARSGAHKKKDKKMKQDLKKALLFRVQSEQDCDAGNIVMGQIENLLQRKHKNSNHWKKIVKMNQGQIEERRIQSEMRLASTENRLYTANLRFNEVQYENKKIREEIEHVLNDRSLFNQSWDQMLIALKKGKKFLGDLFESSTLAYDQRDEWVAKVKTAQEKGKIDQMLQIQEMRDLIKAYNHEMKLYHFLAAKGVTRVNKKQEDREEQEERRENEETIEKYKKHLQILDDIFDYSNAETTKDIVEQFRSREQQNDSIYRLLTDYCAEIQVLRREVKRIRQEACDRSDWNEAQEDKRQRKLESMVKQLTAKRTQTDALRGKLEDTQTLIRETSNKVEDIFNMLDCSLEPFQSLLGDKKPSIYTLKQTLLEITEKIKEHTQTVYYYERHVQKKGDRLGSSRLNKFTVRDKPTVSLMPSSITRIVLADPCPSCVETRWFSRISDGLQTPMDRRRAIKALSDLSSDPAYLRSDRIHPITECKVPRSRALLAKRYMEY